MQMRAELAGWFVSLCFHIACTHTLHTKHGAHEHTQSAKSHIWTDRTANLMCDEPQGLILGPVTSAYTQNRAVSHLTDNILNPMESRKKNLHSNLQRKNTFVYDLDTQKFISQWGHFLCYSSRVCRCAVEFVPTWMTQCKYVHNQTKNCTNVHVTAVCSRRNYAFVTV